MRIKSSTEQEYSRSTIVSQSGLILNGTLYISDTVTQYDFSYNNSFSIEFTLELNNKIYIFINNYDSWNQYISLFYFILDKSDGSVTRKQLYEFEDADWYTGTKYENWHIYINYKYVNNKMTDYDIEAEIYSTTSTHHTTGADVSNGTTRWDYLIRAKDTYYTISWTNYHRPYIKLSK